MPKYTCMYCPPASPLVTPSDSTFFWHILQEHPDGDIAKKWKAELEDARAMAISKIIANIPADDE